MRGKCTVINIFAYICQAKTNHNVTTMEFSERLKELREQKGLLQRQLASALLIDTPMYSRIERGEHKAKREQIIFTC